MKEKGMRNIILLCALIGLTTLTAMSQVRFGVRAGGAYSSMIQKINNQNKVGARFGFSVAGLTEIPLSQRFSIYSELAFANQGGSFLSNYFVDGASK